MESLRPERRRPTDAPARKSVPAAAMARFARAAAALLVPVSIALFPPTLAADPAPAAGTAPSRTASFHSVPLSGGFESAEPAPLLSRVPLLDFSRLKVSHSLSYAFTSGGPRNTSTGLFVSSFDYRLASPLSMRLDLGAALDRARASTGRGPEVFVKGLALDYSPGDSFRLQLSYRTLPRGPWYGTRSLRPGE